MTAQEAIDELRECLDKGLFLDGYPVRVLIKAYEALKKAKFA